MWTTGKGAIHSSKLLRKPTLDSLFKNAQSVRFTLGSANCRNPLFPLKQMAICDGKKQKNSLDTN
jgi:hypothetical protein